MILFSIVTPVYKPDLRVFKDTARSVLKQTFAHWEWILIDDHSEDPELAKFIDRISRNDSRVRVITRETNGGIVRASNDGLAAARGEFIALLDHDDQLARHALSRVAAEATAHDDLDYLYTDEDKIGSFRTHYHEFHKPDWSPERLRGQMYTGHLSVLRTSLVRRVGGFREEYEGSQDHDLVLRVTEVARRIIHIPEILYHWRAVEGSTASTGDNKPYAWDAGVRAVTDHLERVGLKATARRGPVPGTYQIVREPELDRSVSVIIPTRGDAGVVFGAERVFVVEAVRSLLAGTQHRNLEIVVVHDSSTPPSVIDDLQNIAGERLVLVEYDLPFNFSHKCNVGYLASRGEVLIFLNDDVEAVSSEIPGSLSAVLAEPDVGMVGAKLWYENKTLQHAGHLYARGQFTHAYLGVASDALGNFSSLVINREASGLTAACIAMNRKTFAKVGGFSELLPGNFNDVDLCKKVGFLGHRLVWLTDVVLYHFESQTRVANVKQHEVYQVLSRWGGPDRDPFEP